MQRSLSSNAGAIVVWQTRYVAVFLATCIGCTSSPSPALLDADLGPGSIIDGVDSARPDASVTPTEDGNALQDGGQTGPDAHLEGDASMAPRDASAGSTPLHPLVDTVRVGDTWVPVYWAEEERERFRLSLLRRNGMIEAIDEAGRTRWQADLGPGGIFGGFDSDADGWPDFALVKRRELPEQCGGQPQYATWLDVYSGRTADRLTATSPIDPICWTFGTTTYPTSQWTRQSIMFGETRGLIGLFPVYATNAWFFRREPGGGVRSNGMNYPSTASYDRTYRNAQTNAWLGDDRAYKTNSHVANGFLFEEDGEHRALFFTSGRVVQYADEPLGPDQLRFDRPFVSTQEVAGRNYGLVQLDQREGQVLLMSGASIYSVYRDHESQTREYDANGGIERHVAIYDYRENTIDNRYFSRIYDDGGTHHYRNRVVHPGNAWVRRPSGPARIAYSVYDDVRQGWDLHVSMPGQTRDESVLEGMFLWDIRDVDGDGIEEWIVSEADPSRRYFLRSETLFFHWIETETELVQVSAQPGLPVVTLRWRMPTSSTSTGYLPRTSLVGTADGGARLLTFDPSP